MRNFIQNGDTLTFTSPDPVASGQGVVMNALFGVAASAAPAGCHRRRNEGLLEG